MTAALELAGLQQCRGEVTLPGSKSIANRALLMAALCQPGERTLLTNVLRSDDTERMLEALAGLGVDIDIDAADATRISISGCGGKWAQVPAELNLGNAGTAIRPLTAVLSATLNDQNCVLTGNQRMQERPLAALTEALCRGGADICYLENQGYPPVRLAGGLRGGHLTIDGSESSQYISALLIALPLLPNDSVLQLQGQVVSWPYIELTLAMLERFGIQIHRISGQEFMIPGQQGYRSPSTYWIEGDASAASYWLAAGVLGGGPLRVHGIGQASIQGDLAFASYLADMGGNLDIGETFIDVSGGRLRAIDADLNAIPDAAMTFATLALFAEGTTHIRNIGNWRIKETDRLHAMATELRKTGAVVDEFADSIRITPPAEIAHASIATYDDHRMAMCFALLGFAAAGVRIIDPDCCRKTYPGFFSEFKRLCR
ncbi:3-phosphoshikimate 1-carboxyvinyltransferase [Pseudidiomarina salinarum]|uniref:3-phosphoshikimate 1-carboxyvinyltransferase n=1 Tax=Pseudidiomarina salinarum TaxID=435908 RepID=A0A094J1M5_9GAMM|nr:3-phosphoshikimate 1-carboxyvinyltransferase [Pseudidiomarina salinarum]KFZ31954.1 3-phosphoshikimate 1-carboxyvinyltransferase [Pseudidiomarina salinarum]RUO70269.1 3-phosphoshikimate 1-carboxyvinyltransferase [Pseudidiomarina salinarum]